MSELKGLTAMGFDGHMKKVYEERALVDKIRMAVQDCKSKLGINVTVDLMAPP